MKKRNRFPITKYLFLLLFAILFGANSTFAQLNNYSSSKLVGINADEYLSGAITIKVKEGIGPFEQQKSNVSFGINTLDERVQQFSITTLNKRFKHKPIPKNSGLPALGRIYKIEFPLPNLIL